MTDFNRGVDARPEKEFFVSMLTRDIELGDAILDLLDNCLDGVHRTLDRRGSVPVADESRLFEGFGADLNISAEEFSIQDNCGGIPRKDAADRAFRMGRPPGPSDNIGTVGMYGIGMKRAIFKLGRHAIITSRPADHDEYSVTITPEWIDRQDEWHLPMGDAVESLPQLGTKIIVSTLRSDVARQFNPESSRFIPELKKKIAQTYSLILEKGFSVTVNGESIAPASLLLLSAQSAVDQVIHPYYYSGTIGGVEVEIFAGLYRRLPDDEEADEGSPNRFSSDDAGWTIACNDRIVVFKDKTRLTGWGEAGVPSFHGQFTAFSGLVLMDCSDPSKLPLTTTKRGLDGGSEVYLITKELMRKSTKTFTSFTYKWKPYLRQRDELYSQLTPTSIHDVRTQANQEDLRRERTTNGREFIPKLPVPAQYVENQMKSISFQRPLQDIRQVSQHLFGETDKAPSLVGQELFDRELRSANRQVSEVE